MPLGSCHCRCMEVVNYFIYKSQDTGFFSSLGELQGKRKCTHTKKEINWHHSISACSQCSPFTIIVVMDELKGRLAHNNMWNFNHHLKCITGTSDACKGRCGFVTSLRPCPASLQRWGWLWYNVYQGNNRSLAHAPNCSLVIFSRSVHTQTHAVHRGHSL